MKASSCSEPVESMTVRHRDSIDGRPCWVGVGHVLVSLEVPERDGSVDDPLAGEVELDEVERDGFG